MGVTLSRAAKSENISNSRYTFLHSSLRPPQSQPRRCRGPLTWFLDKKEYRTSSARGCSDEEQRRGRGETLNDCTNHTLRIKRVFLLLFSLKVCHTTYHLNVLLQTTFISTNNLLKNSFILLKFSIKVMRFYVQPQKIEIQFSF